MKQGWTYKKLGEICRFFSGFAFKSNKFTKNGMPIIRISDIQNGEINDTNVVYFNPSDYEQDLSRYIIYPGEILIAMSGGTTGKIGKNKTSKEFYLNQRVGAFRENKSIIEHDYLFYYLLTKSKESLRIAAGAAQPNLSSAQINNFIIPVPPISEQERIVEWLDAAFAQIDELKSNAEKQLAEARALFQSALTQAMQPKPGWQEKTLKELSIIAGDYGLSVPSKPFDGVRYLRITDITEWGELNNELVSADISADDNSKDKLEEGDILFARTGATVGKTLVYKTSFGECLFAGYLIRYRLNKKEIMPQFMHYITHSTEYYDWVQSNQKAAAQPNINAKKYNSYIVKYPILSEQESIVAQLDALFARVYELEEINRKTAAECDALKQALLRQIFE